MRELSEMWYVSTDDEATVKRCVTREEALGALEEAKGHCEYVVELMSVRTWVREEGANAGGVGE